MVSRCSKRVVAGTLVFCATLFAARIPETKEYTNSIGMKFVRVEPGKFIMGESATPLPDELTKHLSYPTRESLVKAFPHGDASLFEITVDHVRNGDYDEKPAHRVRIRRPYYVGALEVTNAQYELFDSGHRALRGKNGFSKEDDEAVVFVSWYDAKAYCDWLSDQEGLPYRLATEAEWEYACRAGTTTPFFTGNSLPKQFHKNARRTSFNQDEDKVLLHVGKTPANAWGIYDMHGNVEEWCEDWYGPYTSRKQRDPVGRITGDFRVTRGGSHGTNLYYLRSANRMGTLPENKHWLIGFRVVIGKYPKSKPLRTPSPERYQQRVVQEPSHDVTEGPEPDKPYFKGPRRYVRIPKGSHGPTFYHHNHDAGIVECPNGDLLAIWYTCVEERGRELAIAASRLRFGRDEWEEASPFWDAPDRNDHCPALWYDGPGPRGEGTIYHFNGICVAGKWEPLAIIMRTSKDSGVTWSRARVIAPEHNFRQMVGEPVFRTREGAICVGADAERGSTIHVSRDNGLSWNDPGGTIRGIHAGIVQLNDGRLMALGRGQNFDGWMPKSISDDMGKTWKAEAAEFQPLTGGQRFVLMRLKEGPLFFASFAKDIYNQKATPEGMRPPRHVSKIFAAVSFDDGKTWPARRVISAGPEDRPVDTIDNAPVLMNADNSEPLAYLSVCQGLDNVIHLISSTNHYAFNLAWIKERPPAGPSEPTACKLPVRKKLEHVYDATRLPQEAKPKWQFVGKNVHAPDPLIGLGDSVLRIKVGKLTEARWSNERIAGLKQADAHKGTTAEVAVKVRGVGKDAGFDFEVFVRGGSLTVNHYALSITPSGVYYLYDRELVPIAEGLDNWSAIHTYRLAVRDDTAVQIYRDGKLIGIQRADLLISWSIPARGSYIEWGAGSANVLAVVDHVAYDLRGPSRPK